MKKKLSILLTIVCLISCTPNSKKKNTFSSVKELEEIMYFHRTEMDNISEEEFMSTFTSQEILLELNQDSKFKKSISSDTFKSDFALDGEYYNEVRRKIAREKKRGNTFKLEKFKFKTFDLEGGDLLYKCRMWVDDISLSNYEMMVLRTDNKFYIIGFQ